jgi:DNA-binding Lrp family transcriptional regulator
VDTQKLKLLFALQENPIAPASVLAKQIGVSAPTARSWLDSLKEERVFVGVHANLRSRRIGLEMDDFLLLVESHQALQQIEKFCEAHPYTSYRARVFGGDSQGIMLQFRQPDTARKYLLQAFNVMKANGLIRSVRELPTLDVEYGSTFTRPRLDAWDPENMVWRFDWDEWWSSCPESVTLRQDSDSSEEQMVDLDALDVRILQEIGTNARRKNIEIIEALGMDKNESGIQQKVSTRLKRLSDEVIANYRVYINWTYFDVYNTALIIAKADQEITNRLMSYLPRNKFPFSSSIRKIKTGYVWSARLPSAHLSELITLNWRIAKSFEVLIIDYKQSQVYGLWAETFDTNRNTWRTEKEFCLDQPLQAIGLRP